MATADEDIDVEHPKRIANRNQSFISVGNKELKKLQRRAWDAGWWPKKTKSGIMWLAPDQVGQVLLHGTSSDHHAYGNALAEFRNAGLKV
jgi:hypothetical protein